MADPVSDGDREVAKSLAHEQGRVEEVDARRCILDLDYAREPKESRWRPWVTAWNWPLFGLPILSRRDDGYAILDGGHRISAIRAKFGPDIKFNAVVVSDLSREAEAWLFTHLDTESYKPTQAEIFRANLFAKVPEEVDIDFVSRSLGVTIYGVHGASPSGDVASIKRLKGTFAIGTLRTIYRRGGNLHLRKVMEALRDAWGQQHAAFDRFPLSAMSLFWLQWPTADSKRLVVKMSEPRNTPDQLRLTAARLAEAFVNLGAAATYGRRVLGEWYSRGLRKGKLRENDS